jgi:transposase
MKYYAGLDVGLKHTFICIVDEGGKVLHEAAVASDANAIHQALQGRNVPYERIGMETGQLSIFLCKGLAALGLPVVCMDARQVAMALSTTVNKTDKNDARGIAHLLRCGLYRQVHVKSDMSCEQKLLLGARRQLMEQVSTMEGSIRGLLKIYGVALGPARRSAFIPNIHTHTRTLPALVQTAIGALLDTLTQLRTSLKELDNSIKGAAQTNRRCSLLMSIPGVGPLTSMHYLAAVDDAGRFRNARSVGAYMGLTPRQYASGETQHQGRISRCGPPHCRAMLYEAAHCLLHFCKQPTKLKSWGLKLAKKKGMKKAIVAVARKLAVIMHCMLITGEPYDDSKAVAA